MIIARKTSSSKLFWGGLCAVLLTSTSPLNAFAKDTIAIHTSDMAVDVTPNNTAQSSQDITASFKPNPIISTQLDFDIWSKWLNANVFYMGPSIRRKAAPASVETGSRVNSNHSSPYRYEGNKVLYGTLRPNQKKFLKLYQKDLETLSTQTDITHLSRNDQLAYWFNLHNVTLINLIADNHPVKFPDRIEPIKGQDMQLHDAKVLRVAGKSLSLRDIREKIVYQHWQDPIVIYGFHDGSLGGPNIAIQAYDRHVVNQLLTRNAEEFTNSFRGYKRGKISPIYKNVSQFFFPAGHKDIRPHLQRFMRPEVFKDLSSYNTLKWHKPIRDIADLSGGHTGGSARAVQISGEGITGVPQYLIEFKFAQARNFAIAKKRGWLPNGNVIIEDIDTIDPDFAPIEVD